MRDFIENMEAGAEAYMDEATEGLARDFFRCSCGRVARLDHAQPSSVNPYSRPICCICFSEMIGEVKP